MSTLILPFASDATSAAQLSELLAAALDLSRELILFAALPTGEILECNRAACMTLGYEADELTRLNLEHLLPSEWTERLRADFDPAAAPVETTVALRTSAGELLPFELTWRRHAAPEGERLVLVAHPVAPSEAPQPAAQLHDGLTGALARGALADLLNQAGQRATHDGRPFALLFIDLDRFKQINDTWGHLAGDAVLREVAGRLLACVRRHDQVVRFGGDEFVVLVDGVAAAEEVARLVQRIDEALRAPLAIGGVKLNVSASIGVALSSTEHATADELLHAADQAMYRAKTQSYADGATVVAPLAGRDIVHEASLAHAPHWAALRPLG